MNHDEFRAALLIEQYGHTTPEQRHADEPDRHVADHDLAQAARRRELELLELEDDEQVAAS